MSLFIGGGKKEAVENSILQQMSQLPFINDLVANMLAAAEKEPWILNCQSYYDTCVRKVTVEPDAVVITWKTQRELYELEDGTNTGIRLVEGDFGERGWGFTANGYLPLHSHINEKGKIDVSLSRVCYLLAMLIQEQLVAKFHGCQFDAGVTEGRCCASFSYRVPERNWMDWFV